jgi:hypothetical protein
VQAIKQRHVQIKKIIVINLATLPLFALRRRWK